MADISKISKKDRQSWLSAFMIESNDIEGENMVYKNHLEAAELAVSEAFKVGTNSVLYLHKILGERVHAEWVGKFRNCGLIFPKDTPHFSKVPELAEKLFKQFSKISAFEFYIRFEHIHPFCDLNGRVGRLLWLRRTLEENKFSLEQVMRLGFLKIFHYQALEFLKQNPNGLN